MQPIYYVQIYHTQDHKQHVQNLEERYISVNTQHGNIYTALECVILTSLRCKMSEWLQSNMSLVEQIQSRGDSEH